MTSQKQIIANRKNAKNAGRKVGSKSKATLTRDKAFKKFEQRVFKVTGKVFNAQLSQAIGTHKMVRLYTNTAGVPSVEVIRDLKRMDKLFDEGEYGKDYVIVAGKDPDYKAGNALLDRGFGRATESLKLGDPDGKPLIIKIDS